MDNTSSMYLLVRLSRDANCFFAVESKDYNIHFVWIQKDADEKRAQVVHIGTPTVYWKTFPAKKNTKIVSSRNSSILMMSSSEYLFLESECSFTKMFLRALILNICIYGYRFWKLIILVILFFQFLVRYGCIKRGKIKTLYLLQDWKIYDVLITPLNSEISTSDWSHFLSRLFLNTSEDLALYVLAVLWEEWKEVWWNTRMNQQWICVYIDFCASLESNICMTNLVHIHQSRFQMKCRGSICGCPVLLMQKIREIVWRVPRKWVKTKLLCQDADVILFADECIVVWCVVCGDNDKVLMKTRKLSDKIRVTANVLVSGVDRVL